MLRISSVVERLVASQEGLDSMESIISKRALKKCGSTAILEATGASLTGYGLDSWSSVLSTNTAHADQFFSPAISYPRFRVYRWLYYRMKKLPEREFDRTFPLRRLDIRLNGKCVEN
jgi:hypothetical protein